MHLTPEQRAIGKGNFHGAIGSEFTRRDFLKGSLAAGVGVGAGAGGYYFAYDKVSDPVRIGVIGTGDEGSVLIGAHNPAYTRIVAIADIRPYSIYRAFRGDETSAGTLAARPGLLAKYGWSSEDEARQYIKVYEQDYHDLLNDKDVEAVIIALPLHLHAQVTIEALKAGKHVLTEKLMAHSIHECKEMGRIAKESGLLLATGHQRHYSILYDNAVDTLRRRLIGDIHHIRAQWHRGPDSWKFPLPDADLVKYIEGKTADLEKEVAKTSPDRKRMKDIETQIRVAKARILDKDVKAEDYGYQEKQLTANGEVVYTCSPMEELIRWRLWDRTGGGLMAELGSHQLDASSIFISSMYDEVANEFGKKERAKVMPLSVTAVGGRHIYPYDRDVDDHVYCMFEFPAPGYYKDNDLEKREIADPNKKIVVTYSSISGNGFGDYGEVVLGTKGTLILDKEQEVMLFLSGAPTKVEVTKKGDAAPVLQAAESPSSAAVATGKEATGGDGPISRGYTEEIEHWAWCIRNPSPENRPKCHPKVAMADAIIALVSNMAIKDQKRIDFKPEWFDIDSDETPEGVVPDVKKYDRA
jgi:predicted dehydrogenase